MFQTKFITELFDIRLNLISRFIVEILNNNACNMYSMCLLHKKEIIYNFLQINSVKKKHLLAPISKCCK